MKKGNEIHIGTGEQRRSLIDDLNKLLYIWKKKIIHSGNQIHIKKILSKF